ncbi:MAG: RelA/SpoT family protein, partial [Clostridiales bacterium]|nr:RelA/SpoT family protein [Clostridiales bacterium]
MTKKTNTDIFAAADKLGHIADETDVIVQKVIDRVREYSPKSNTDMIYVAYRLAKAAHKNQFRKSGEPYIIHPVQIAYIASELSMDSVAICAGLLHDVIEDTPYTFDNIAMLFGRPVAEIVDGVTKLKKIQYTERQEAQVENLRKMFFAMSKDIRVVIIKLIDRLHNMRTLNFQSREKQLYIAKETLDVYAPLAHRLGISKIKSELEDLSLKYLDPVAYEEIAESINQKKSEREAFVAEIISALKEKMAQSGIECEVTGRAKHFYSIFRKMYAQNKTIDELYDLFAVRIIVNTVAECYAALGIVHEMYTPLPMRFKDYIAMPKPNMYQSLHTTVVGSGGTPFEIQIRTWDMHKVAQEGIAAHWKYKEGKSGEDAMDKELEWVRKLMETQENIMDADQFMNSLKIDMFSDQVFAFTPQGKVIPLPNGSTAIDFAFAIHTQVGSKMVGAKANGKIIPINYKL